MIKHYFMMAAIGCLSGMAAAQAMAEEPNPPAGKKVEITRQEHIRTAQTAWGSHPPVPFLKNTAELAWLLAIKPEHKPDISTR